MLTGFLAALVVVLAVVVIAMVVRGRSNKGDTIDRDLKVEAAQMVDEMDKKVFAVPGYPHIRVGMKNKQIVRIRIKSENYSNIEEARKDMTLDERKKFDDLIAAIQLIKKEMPAQPHELPYKTLRMIDGETVRIYEKTPFNVSETLEMDIHQDAEGNYCVTSLTLMPKTTNGEFAMNSVVYLYMDGITEERRRKHIQTLRGFFSKHRDEYFQSLLDLRDHLMEMEKYNALKDRIEHTSTGIYNLELSGEEFKLDIKNELYLMICDVIALRS